MATQTFGFKPINSKTPFSTLRRPAGVSPLKSSYGTSMQNPISDVLSSTNPFRASAASTPTVSKVLDGGDSGAGFGGTDVGVSPGSPYASGLTPKIPAPKTNPGINDLTADPLLKWTQDIGSRNVQDATSSALANAKGAIVQSGLSNVPDTLRSLFASDPSSPILGALTDTNTLSAAGQNPDSMLAQLAKQHPLAQSGIDAAAGNDNTFYGSRHSEALANEADQYRQAQQGVYGNLGNTLTSILQQVLSAKQGAQDAYGAQLPGAYQRVLDNGAGPVIDDTSNNGPAGPQDIPPPKDTPSPSSTPPSNRSGGSPIPSGVVGSRSSNPPISDVLSSIMQKKLALPLGGGGGGGGRANRYA